MSNRSKLNHFVHQGYLRAFESREEKIWQYDTVEKKCLELPIRGVAAVNDLYTFKDEKGQKTDQLERAFAQLEGQITPVLKKIDTLSSLERNDRDNIALFCSLQWLRTKKNRDRVMQSYSEMMKKIMQMRASYKDGFHKMMEGASKEHPELLKVDKESVRKFAISGDYDVVFSSDQPFLENLLEGMYQFASYIEASDWTILRAPQDTQFITSDDPFTMVLARKSEGFMDGPGLLVPGTEMTIPLTRKSCLLFIPEPSRAFRVVQSSKRIVRVINCRTTNNCYRFMYGGEPTLLKSLVAKTKVCYKRPIKQLATVR